MPGSGGKGLICPQCGAPIIGGGNNSKEGTFLICSKGHKSGGLNGGETSKSDR